MDFLWENAGPGCLKCHYTDQAARAGVEQVAFIELAKPNPI